MPPHLFENIPAVAHEGDVGLGATSSPVVHSGENSNPNLKVLEALKQARSLIAAGHCQNSGARDYDGNSVAPWDESALSFCAYGALQRACGLNKLVLSQTQNEQLELFYRTRNWLELMFPFHEILYTNDRGKDAKDKILAIYDDAIARVSAALA